MACTDHQQQEPRINMTAKVTKADNTRVLSFDCGCAMVFEPQFVPVALPCAEHKKELGLR